MGSKHWGYSSQVRVCRILGLVSGRGFGASGEGFRVSQIAKPSSNAEHKLNMTWAPTGPQKSIKSLTLVIVSCYEYMKTFIASSACLPCTLTLALRPDPSMRFDVKMNSQRPKPRSLCLPLPKGCYYIQVLCNWTAMSEMMKIACIVWYEITSWKVTLSRFHAATFDDWGSLGSPCINPKP